MELPRYCEWEVGGYTRYSTLGKIGFSMDDAWVVLGNSVVVPPQLSLNQSFLLGKFSALGNPPKGILCYKFFVIKQNSQKKKNS
jgi:hypothetical protein